MADEIISTRIVANADFSALIADVHRVTASLSKLQQELASSNKMLANQIAVMNRSFSDTLRSTGQYSTHFVSLQSDVEKFGKNLDGGKLKLNQYFNAFRDQAKTSGGLIRDLAKQQVALQNAVLQPLGRNAQGLMQFNVHVPRGLDEVKNKTAIARQELQIMNKVIQDGAGQLINWGKNTQWAGRQLTVGLTVPLVAFGKAAADAFKQADQELVRLTKVYGDVAGTSSAELSRVRDEVSATAKEISAAMGVSFKETIGLAADIAATGKTGDELLGSIKETTRLAVLGEVDRQEAMKATLAIQSAFKQNTDELSESINFLNAVENQTSTTLNDLVEAIPKAGPVIKGLGGSVQDLALYLTAMREGGINASEGANALKSALASLINPTDVAVGKFQTLGIDLLGIVNNNAGDLTGTLMTLQAALDNLDPLQKQQAIEQLFGKFQFARLNALFENLGRQGSQTLQVLDLMKASTGDLASVADRELAAVTESASGKYRRAIESLRASLAEVGEQFLTINTVLIQVIDKVVQFANNLPGPVKQVLALAGGFTAVIGPVIMLTGVLANFFGYILKGIFHMKSFFKGGEGWKYLTPEMLAAEKAGRLVEQSFYSDAKAAAVLKQALGNLIDEFSILEAKAKSGAMSVNPAVSTMAGNLVMASGGSRVVNPDHPLAGAQGTRASSHMVPRSGMTEAQRMQQTMFGMVPGSIPVNQKIGQNPQIYMNEQLPNVPGLTTVGGVSTGVVSGEAARHHAMMATLAMQSKAEIAQLKQTIAATGTVSKDFMNQFDDILPIVSRLTDNAARESGLIVAELRAGKISIEAARAKIVALNLETERMIASSMQTQATAMGRTINPTMVPTLNQPVVDATGKSNMRELFKKGKTRDFINRIAGALGVRTSGAGYNIETTVPKKFNMGGYVYTMNDGNIVPGPSVNRDIVPAVLTPGEFVVNREATQANLPLLTAINNGYNNGGKVKFERGHVGPQISAPKSGIGGLYSGSGKTSHVSQGIPIWMTSTLNQETRTGRAGLTGRQVHAEFTTALKNGRHPFEPLITAARSSGMPGEEAKILAAFDEMMNDLKGRNSRTLFVGGTPNSFEKYFSNKVTPRFGKRFQELFNSFGTAYGQRGSRDMVAQGNVSINPKTGRMTGIRGRGNPLARGISSSVIGSSGGGGNLGIGRSKLSSSLASAAMAIASRGRRRNDGGIIPGYNMGGMVQGYNDGGDVKPITFGSARKAEMSKGFIGSKFATGPMAGLGLGMGMQMAGGAMGGSMGQALQMASIIPMIAPQMLGNIPGMLTKITAGLKGVGGMAGLAGKAIGFAFRIGPLAAITAAITLAVVGFKKLKEEQKQNRIEATNSIAITEDSAKEAGIKYNNLSDKIKLVNEQLELVRAKGANAYATLNSAGIQGLTLTIAELRDGIKNAKENAKELVGTFSDIDVSGDSAKQAKVTEIATNLKAEFVAAGMSAADATNKIYTIIAASDKAGMAFNAISSKGFRDILDVTTAAEAKVISLNQNMGKLSGSDLGASISSTANALDKQLDSIMKTKDENGELITQQEAINQLLADINSKQGSNNKITQLQLNSLKETHPELEKILNTSDNTASIYAKQKLIVMGVRAEFKNMSAEQAQALLAFNAALETAITAQEKLAQGSGISYKSQQAIDKMQKQIAAGGQKASIAAQKTQDQIKAEIKLIDKRIDAINKEAEARKKALQDSQNKENLQLEIQKAQLEYADKLAAGDMAGAAQAQLRIKQLLGERDTQKAIDAIEENRKKREDEQIAKKEKLQEASDKAATNLANAQNNAANVTTRMAKIDAYQNQYQAIVKEQARIDAILKEKPGDKQALKDLQDLVRGPLGDLGKQVSTDAKGKDKALAQELKNIFTGTLIDKDGKSLAGTVTESLGSVGSGGQYNPTYGYVPGAADRAVKADADAALAAANKIMGGSSLRNVVEAVKGIGVAGSRTKDTAMQIEGNYGENTNKGGATQEMKQKMANDYKIQVGQFFKYKGQTYKMTDANSFIRQHDGGKITGPGTGTSDSIPAYLSNGEFVINAASAEKFGYENLEKINKMAAGGRATRYNIPSYSMGGRINYEDGGAAFTRSNINVTVNAAPGMDERALADMVINRISTASRNLNSKTGEGLRA